MKAVGSSSEVYSIDEHENEVKAIDQRAAEHCNVLAPHRIHPVKLTSKAMFSNRGELVEGVCCAGSVDWGCMGCVKTANPRRR